MKKMILLLTLFTFLYSTEKWEYLMGEFNTQTGFISIGSIDGGDESINNYITLIEEGEQDASYYIRAALKTALNKVGSDGWELINIAHTSLNPAKTQREIKKPHLVNVFYFKRKVTD